MSVKAAAKTYFGGDFKAAGRLSLRENSFWINLIGENFRAGGLGPFQFEKVRIPERRKVE